MKNRKQDILGIYPGHDATMVVLRDGKIVEAMSEEKVSSASCACI